MTAKSLQKKESCTVSKTWLTPNALILLRSGRSDPHFCGHSLLVISTTSRDNASLMCRGSSGKDPLPCTKQTSWSLSFESTCTVRLLHAIIYNYNDFNFSTFVPVLAGEERFPSILLDHHYSLNSSWTCHYITLQKHFKSQKSNKPLPNL